MKDHPESQAFFKTLIQLMKTKKVTYKSLAVKLGVSEVTIKRMFSNRNAPIDRLIQICEILGTSFLDVTDLARQENEVNYFLTPSQEEFFSKNLAYFGIFKMLYDGMSASALVKEWGVTQAKIFLVLRKLESLKLLDLHPQNEVRFRIKGVIRLSHRGPLAKTLLRSQIDSFLDHVDQKLENKDVCFHSAELQLSEQHVQEFVAEIHELGARYRSRAYRDQSLLPKTKLKSVRWLFAFAPYKTDWRKFSL